MVKFLLEPNGLALLDIKFKVLALIRDKLLESTYKLLEQNKEYCEGLVFQTHPDAPTNQIPRGIQPIDRWEARTGPHL